MTSHDFMILLQILLPLLTIIIILIRMIVMKMTMMMNSLVSSMKSAEAASCRGGVTRELTGHAPSCNLGILFLPEMHINLKILTKVDVYWLQIS